MHPPLYRIRELVKRRQRQDGYELLIRRLDIARGSRLAITGPSGCGKSTTLDLLGLALAPDSAEEFSFSPEGRPVDLVALWRQGQLDQMARLRLAHMGYVLQSGELLPYLNVRENIMLTARLAGKKQDSAIRAAESLAERLDIASLLSAMPATLSVGERQRAAIARALASAPELILADEPTAALDPLRAEDVMRALLDAVKEQGGALIVVTHNHEWARRAGLEEISIRIKKGEHGARAILDQGGSL